MLFKKIFLGLFFFVLVIPAILFVLLKKNRPLAFFSENYSKNVSLIDAGLTFNVLTTAKNVNDFLNENKIELDEHDLIFPERNSPIVSGSKIEIKRSKKISIDVDGKTVNKETLRSTIAGALSENGIQVGKLDQVTPALFLPPISGQKIIITRINIEEKVVQEEIDFKSIIKNDNRLSWREEKIEKKGEKGIREIKYKITYKNNQEISRVVLSKNITREPIAEIKIKGTYIKIGKVHTGLGTWYTFKNGLFAANPWLPIGSYVRVTNKANGKSVIVQINDRGPFGSGRIIDLDKVAFQKIASLGAGVINVKMEEILN